MHTMQANTFTNTILQTDKDHIPKENQQNMQAAHQTQD